MKKTNSWNRLLSLVLCLCMVLSLVPASALSVFATEGTDTAVSYAAKIGDTYYPTLAQAAGAVTEDSNTIEVLTDVTIDADETVTFAAFAQLSVADGKTITCNGTVMIGEDEGIIFENTLYYYGGDVTNEGSLIAVDPTYFTAGNGYTIGQKKNDTQTFVVEMVNASVNREHGHGIFRSSGSDEEKMHIKFSGTNTIEVTGNDSGAADAIRHETAGGLHDVIISGMEGAVLNISVGDAPQSSEGIRGKSVTITGGTVNVASGNVQDGLSYGIVAASVVVEEGATLNLTVGKAEVAVGSAGLVSGAGTINGLVVVPADNAGGFAFAASGNTVLIADFSAVGFGEPIPFSVPEDTTLTVKENVTLDLSGLTVADFTFAGTVINHGIILLPADFALDDAPKSGTIRIGEKGYIYDSGKWYCTEDSHTGGEATCTEKAVCDLCGISYGKVNPDAHIGGTATCTTRAVCETCGASYGEVDSTNHDKTVSFDDNGFCPNGCYEEAVWNEEDGVYEISNAGQLYWFMEKVNSGDNTINGVLTADIVVNRSVLQSDGTLNGDGTNFRAWFPIGYWHDCDGDGEIEDLFFSGVFDGRGHTVSGLYFNNEDQTCVGLFGSIHRNATVKNVGVIDSYLNGNDDVGAVAGYNEGTVTGCYSNASVSSGDGMIGGVVGENQGAVENCYHTGAVIGSHQVGGVVGSNDGAVTNCYHNGTVSGENYVGGAVGENSGAVTNCYNTGSVSGGEKVGGMVGYNEGTVTNCHNTGAVSCSGRGIGGVVGGNTGTVTNCYYLDTCGASGNGTAKTANQFASGEVAYLLNGDQTTIVFKQTIGTDASPNFTGKTVYYGYPSCAEDAQMVYSNNETIRPDHSYENGICASCGAYESAVLNDGIYTISNAGQLLWFAKLVNAGNFTAGAVLTSDIDMDGLHWTPIGTETAYTGTFDGRGFAIKNLWQNSDGTNGNKNGLVVILGAGGVVMGVTIDHAAIWGADLYSTNAAGAIANRNYGTICDCVVKNSSIQQGAYEYLGGIAGENSGTIENCAVIGCSFTRRWGGTDAGSMGAIAQTNNGTVKNCFSYGCSFNNGRADKAAIVAVNNGTLENCYYYTTGTVATTYGTAKTPEQFASGEVAYLLGEAFGQTIGADGHPILGGKKVYYGYVSCADDAVQEYTNNENASAEKPDHTGTLGEYELTADGAQHARKWSCCGSVVTEKHSTTADGDKAADCNSKAYCSVCKSEYGEADPANHDKTVHFDDNGFCPNGCYEPATLNADDYYEISNAGQLYWFAAKLSYEDATLNGILTADIVVNRGTMTAETTDARVWIRIMARYNGTFDGNNKTISGLYFNDRDATYVGLFSFNQGTVKNVGVINSYFGANGNVGSIAGYNSGTVTNCYSTGTVSGNEKVSGVVGNNTGTVTNCYNTGTVSGSNNVGGVVGDNTGTVTNCYNTGAVSGSNDVGGVVGNNAEIVTNCYNTGSVNGNNDVGGVAGNNDGTVTNCYNTGSVNGNEKVGGVAGYNDNSITDCYSIGSVSGTGFHIGGVVGYSEFGTMTNCYNAGSVSGSYNVGSVVGNYKFLTLKNCYYLSGCATDGSGVTQFGVGHQEMGSTTADDPGCVDAKTATQFASGEVAYLLGEAFGQTIGADDHPILSGKKVYQVTNCKGETAYRNTEENGAHTEQTVTGKAPTCTETGLTDGVICSVCGETLTTQEEIPVLSHSYEDDVCTVCGHIGVPVKLDSASLSFKEKIHYNIFFSLGLDETVDLSDMGLVMFDSLKTDGTMDDAIAIYAGAVEMDGKYMVATDGVPAKYMGDTIYFRAYAKLADGSYVYSKTVEYSTVTYAEHILNSDKPESAKALVVAMLNYGAAAQMFFGYNTDNLVNTFLTDEQKALPEQYRDDMANTVPVVAAEKQGIFANNKGFNKRAPAVSFEGAFEINYFFTPAYAPVDGITLYYWTEADFEANEVLTVDNATGSLKLEGTGTEQYRGDIGGIAAKNLSENIYVAAVYYDGTTTWTSGVLGYSIGAYCGRLATNGGTIADLAMATAVYGYHAKAYFG